MTRKRSVAAFVISIISGVMLLVSGTRGPSGIFQLIVQQLPSYTQNTLILSLASIGVLVLITLSWVGGIIVMFGGYLIFKTHVRTGKLLIGLGGGIGIPWLIFILFQLAITTDIAAIIAQHSIVGWTGMLLAFLARAIA